MIENRHFLALTGSSGSAGGWLQAMARVQAIRQTPAEIAARRAKIDEYGEIKRRLQLVAPDEARAKLLKQEIESWHKDDPAEQAIVERGSLYDVQLSPRRNERTVTGQKKAFTLLRKALGMDGLIAAIRIPLTLIDKVIPKIEQYGLVTEARTGYRAFTVVPISAPILPSSDLPKAA
jgi:hypothetical protein